MELKNETTKVIIKVISKIIKVIKKELVGKEKKDGVGDNNSD